MNKELEQKLIEKHGYMLEEKIRSKKIMQEHNKLLDELVEARKEKNEEKIEEIRKRQEAIGCYFPIAFGCECDDGWYELLNELMTKIEAIDPEKKVSVHQIKEKFGGLRFYIGDGSIRLDILNVGSFTSDIKSDFEEIHTLISDYEDKSYTICEVCGKPGRLCKTIGGNWLKTVCKEHRKLKTWTDAVQEYLPCRAFADHEEVITPEKEVCKVLAGIFKEEKDCWVYTLNNRKVYDQEQLVRKPRPKLGRNWFVTRENDQTEYVIENTTDFDIEKGWCYLIRSEDGIYGARALESELTPVMQENKGYKFYKIRKENNDA